MELYTFLTKPYKDGTSLDKIIEGSWARNLPIAQTIMEAKVMGFALTEGEILTEWDKLNREMIEDAAKRSI